MQEQLPTPVPPAATARMRVDAAPDTAQPEPVLSVIMPVYNERTTIRHIVERVLASPWVGQLIIVDDCSQDGTTDLLRDEIASMDSRISVVFHDVNKGKGEAIKTSRALLQCPYCIIQDADLEYEPADYGRLVEPLRDGLADVVYGSRFRGDVRRVLFFWHAVGNKFLTLLSNVCTNLNLTDMETCYKAFRTDVFTSLPLRSRGFGIEPEITAKIARRGLRIYEVPISYHGRTYSEGKKIGWKDGVIAIYVILRERLLGRRDLSHGHRTLEGIAPLRRYHRFLWDAVADHAGRKVIEIGAGIGNISQFLTDRERVWLTDVEDEYLRALRARCEGLPNTTVHRLDLTKPLAGQEVDELREVADTVVAFNVLEHIEDDVRAFETIGETLQPDGRLLLVVPAGPALYGALDEELGHCRRYRRGELEERLQQAGYEVESTSWANAVGAFGWWLNARILRRRHIPAFQARFNNLLVPLLRLERALGVPFGLSLVVVARRVASQENHG